MRSVRRDGPPVYDVAILGAGLGGSLLATLLAANGHSVVVVEAGSHPRFTIGEAVVPEFGARCRLLADQFRVPELHWLSSYATVCARVSSNCGVKRNFTFVEHRDGERPGHAQWSQFQTMSAPLGPDSHLYRPDVDAWVLALAVQYGADYLEQTSVDAVDVGADEVRLQAGARTLRARFVVDGTGGRGVLAQRLGLRVETPRYATNSRSLFTHAVGVGSVLDALGPAPVPSPPDQGTLHHMIPGGWYWVIPFGNATQPTNPVCSVGLTLDATIHPDPGGSAEDEFAAITARFPGVATQFAGLRPVRRWVKTGRLQYETSALAGDRWCLLPHSSSFIDPLFSGGLVQTLIGVHELARVLLRGLAEDELGGERFEALTRLSYDNLTVHDQIVHGAYVATRSPGLFDAWYRVWAVGSYHGSAALIRLHMKYLATKDRAYLEQAHQAPYQGFLGGDHPRIRALFDAAYGVMQQFERGACSGAEARDRLFGLLEAEWVPPSFGAAERERRHLTSFTLLPLLRVIAWGKRNAPEDMREPFYDVGPVYFWELTRAMAREAWRHLSGFGRTWLEAHWSRARV